MFLTHSSTQTTISLPVGKELPYDAIPCARLNKLVSYLSSVGSAYKHLKFYFIQSQCIYCPSIRIEQLLSGCLVNVPNIYGNNTYTIFKSLHLLNELCYVKRSLNIQGICLHLRFIILNGWHFLSCNDRSIYIYTIWKSECFSVNLQNCIINKVTYSRWPDC